MWRWLARIVAGASMGMFVLLVLAGAALSIGGIVVLLWFIRQ